MKRIRIGLFGAGRIGKLHGENLAHAVPEAELCAIADPFMTAEIRDWATDLGVEKCYDDPERIFSDASIDAVFICSSTKTHADYIKRAAQSGKHVFCEKPIDTDIAKIEEVLEAVRQAGIKLQVGFVRRFDHNHKMVRDTVSSGRLGKPHVIKVCSRDPEGPPMSYIAVSGGIFMDMMIHVRRSRKSAHLVLFAQIPATQNTEMWTPRSACSNLPMAPLVSLTTVVPLVTAMISAQRCIATKAVCRFPTT